MSPIESQRQPVMFFRIALASATSVYRQVGDQIKKVKWAPTLLRLLMVAGVIAVVGAIAVPAFREKQIQRKLLKERVSLRAINGALVAYAIELNADPPDLSFLTRPFALDHPVRWQGVGPIVSQLGPWIKEIPTSVFGEKAVPQYHIVGNDWIYLLWTPGPDEVYDIVSSDELRNVVLDHYMAPAKQYDWFSNQVYDPSNGLISRGDMVQWRE